MFKKYVKSKGQTNHIFFVVSTVMLTKYVNLIETLVLSIYLCYRAHKIKIQNVMCNYKLKRIIHGKTIPM